MGKIYSSAARVLIYLGPTHDAGAEALDLVDAGDDFSQPGAQQLLRTLASKPYFTRTWVVQEAGLATNATITCGN